MSRRDLPVRRGLAIPAAELCESASRAGGPGGQHVNKVSTRVTLRWNALESAVLTPTQLGRLRRRLRGRLTRKGELVVHARRHRSRARNRELARERLAQLVREALASRKPRVPSRPSRTAREATLAAKRHRSRVKRSRRPVRDEE
jgi:ribosome-associated protein